MLDKVPALTHKQMLNANRDYEHAASLMKLVYVNDQKPGIERIKKGKNYVYYPEG